MGIALDPNFATNNHFYVAYTPLPNSSTEMRVSRFTLTGDTFSLASERNIFTFSMQRSECCHSSGSLAFGPERQPLHRPRRQHQPVRLRRLSPRSTSARAARSGTPSARRPTRTPTAARSCASTRSRTRPARASVRATRSRPGNLFPEAQDTGNKTLPEIFAMGFRNPFRITVDPKTGKVLMGDYGPDAGSTNPNRGPAGQRRVQRRHAGQLRLAVLRPRQRPVQRLQLRDQRLGPKFNCAAPVNTRPTTRA